MNGAFQLLEQRTPIPLQNMYPPYHNHMKGIVKNVPFPACSTRIPIEKAATDPDFEFNSVQVDQRKQENKWVLDIPVLIIGEKMTSDGRNALLQITVESDFHRSFPQSHKISLVDPTDDIFFHWTFSCTPFTYKSLSKQMKWSFPQTAGSAYQEHFKTFASLLQQCAKDTLLFPDRYRAIVVIQSESMATLIFREIVHNYRKIDLLTLDFIPSPFSDIKRDVTEFTKRVFAQNEKSQTELVHVLEKIATHQPSILLHSNGLFDPLPIHQPDEWIKARERLHKPPAQSMSEHIEKTKDFLLETEANESTDEAVLRKPFTLAVIQDEKATQRELIFTFCYTVYHVNLESWRWYPGVPD
jgi:hypothetical protein